jgi:hypothetical protein
MDRITPFPCSIYVIQTIFIILKSRYLNCSAYNFTSEGAFSNTANKHPASISVASSVNVPRFDGVAKIPPSSIYSCYQSSYLFKPPDLSLNQQPSFHQIQHRLPLIKTSVKPSRKRSVIKRSSYLNWDDFSSN